MQVVRGQNIVGEEMVIRGVGAGIVATALQRIMLREILGRDLTCMMNVREKGEYTSRWSGTI